MLLVLDPVATLAQDLRALPVALAQPLFIDAVRPLRGLTHTPEGAWDAYRDGRCLPGEVRAIEGVPMRTYVDWMATCYAVSCFGSPAISVPCGFSAEGLPVGLQIVGRPGADLDVLAIARAFEQATRHAERRPALVLAS